MRFVKNRQAKAAQARRVPLTEEQWQRRREAIGSTQSSHEQAVARVAAVTETDRRRAVVFEQTFPGQTSRARMFWSALSASAALFTAATATFPFLSAQLFENATRSLLDRERNMSSRVDAIRFWRDDVFHFCKDTAKDESWVSPDGSTVYPAECPRCLKRHVGGIMCFLGDMELIGGRKRFVPYGYSNEVQLQSGVHQYCREMDDIVFLRVRDANSHVASEAAKRTPSGPA